MKERAAAVVSAADMWCKIPDLKDFIKLGDTKLREIVAAMEMSGEYDDAIIELGRGIRLFHVKSVIDYLVKTQSIRARKEREK